MVLYPVENFFELHSWATEGEEDEEWVQKRNFLANYKGFNGFINLFLARLKTESFIFTGFYFLLWM